VESIFSKRLKEVRDKKGLTQDDIAIGIRSHKSTISMYENGFRRPSHDMIIKIAEYLNVSADYLIGLTDNPSEKLKDDSIQFHQLTGLLRDFFSDPEVLQHEKDTIFQEVNKLYWKFKE
jgi:transcriptional regulator with XRE-family HTH domain